MRRLTVKSILFFKGLFMQPVLPFQFEVPAQVQPPHFLIICQFFGGTVFIDFSLDHQVGAIADGKGFRYIVIGDQDPDILVFQFGNDRLYILHGNGIDTGERFIQ